MLIIAGLGFVYFIFLDIVKNFGIPINLWSLVTLILGGSLGVMCIIAFLISISKKDKRRRIYDNFAIIGTNITLWPYILLNLTIYFFLNSSTISTTRGGGAGQVISITDLVITIFILIISMRGMGGKTDWKFGILKREGFILSIYSAIAGQYGIRYLLFRQQLVPINAGDFITVLILYELIVNIGEIPVHNFWSLIVLPNFPLNPYFNTFLIAPRLEFLINMGNLITSIAVMGLLLMALIIYGTSAKKFGTLFRVHEVGAKVGRATTEFIYDFMKGEFVRRKRPFPLSEVQQILAKSMELDLNKTLRLINKTDLKYKDFNIDGKKKRYIYFD